MQQLTVITFEGDSIIGNFTLYFIDMYQNYTLPFYV